MIGTNVFPSHSSCISDGAELALKTALAGGLWHFRMISVPEALFANSQEKLTYCLAQLLSGIA